MLTDQQLAEMGARATAVPRRVRQNAAAYASLLLERRDAESGERAAMHAERAEHAFQTMERDVDALSADNAALLADLRDARAVATDALRAAHHALTLSHNLLVTDKPNEYDTALAEGCGADGANAARLGASWTTDHSTELAQIDAALAAFGATPTPTPAPEAPAHA